ncbi:MAG: NCAIR mutase (PurE)-related protein [Myxococcota bacterium]|jgi:NCAIR mutase (PurE)-related protein
MIEPAKQLALALRALADSAENGDVLAKTDLGFAVVDDGRAARTGIPEVIYGSGKTPGQLVELIRHFQANERPSLATRVSPEAAAEVLNLLPDVTYEVIPRLLWWAPNGKEAFSPRYPNKIVVCSAGTSDQSVAQEAVRCAQWFGLDVTVWTDVGVAGLHRLVDRLPEAQDAHAIIAVAGMEGALPSVLAGLVRAPVIAVPTSVGYGTQMGGWVPLLAMLNSCASGVTVVNVDNGFGAAIAAWRMAARRS